MKTMYRLDEWLVRKGIFESRKRAIKFIKEVGVQVQGRHVTKPSYRVTPPVELHLDLAKAAFYNKPQGYHKLSHVVQQLEGEVFTQDDVCLDIGSNVGGFSLYLLEQGVASVDAIEISADFESSLQRIAERWPNFSYRFANFFEVVPSLPKKYTVITADLTIDPHFLRLNLEKFFLPLTTDKTPKRVFITVKLGKNLVNIGMLEKIELKLHQLYPSMTTKWLDSLFGRQEKILFVQS